jgi:hypothetical protein
MFIYKCIRSHSGQQIGEPFANLADSFKEITTLFFHPFIVIDERNTISFEAR